MIIIIIIIGLLSLFFVLKWCFSFIVLFLKFKVIQITLKEKGRKMMEKKSNTHNTRQWWEMEQELLTAIGWLPSSLFFFLVSTCASSTLYTTATMMTTMVGRGSDARSTLKNQKEMWERQQQHSTLVAHHSTHIQERKEMKRDYRDVCVCVCKKHTMSLIQQTTGDGYYSHTHTHTHIHKEKLCI